MDRFCGLIASLSQCAETKGVSILLDYILCFIVKLNKIKGCNNGNFPFGKLGRFI